jgi:predicted Zn-dependent protease
MKQYPEHPVVISLNAMLLTARNDVVAARREFERALVKDGGQLEALAGLTLLDVKSGQLERARTRLNESLKRTPDNVALLILAAQTDLGARDYAQAETRLRHAIQRDPSNQTSYSLLVRTYMQQQKLDEARQELERIVQREPASVSALTLIATIHEVQQRPEEAEKAYRRVLEVDPTAPVAANNLAYKYADRNERLEEALALAQAAAVRLKDHPDVMDTLGWVYYKKGRADQAILQFESAIEKDPVKALYRYHIGLAYMQTGEPEKATRALEEALRLNPSSAEAADARRRLATLKGSTSQ